MKFQFEFDHVTGNEDIKAQISSKFSALEKYLVNVREDFHKGLVRVIKGDRWGYTVRVDVSLPGKNVVAESHAATLLDATDEAYHKTARIIRKYLERLKEKKR
jgi:ribosomal subunit interface protein